MTTFQKLLITALFFLAGGIFYYAYQLTIPKPIVPTVTERCFNACKISVKVPDCVDTSMFLDKTLSTSERRNKMTESNNKCEDYCPWFCKEYPNPEYFIKQ